ncbi:monosaccharide transporter [Aspergillus sclerotioniger CBS 115572]|uniref:Monosaccharide transporter n=1 Tax=Aspergillus sclerotioniger CBS 115572 TaxID=1450535 RepID=A0A317WVJ6_9EURO|nr:monosaccharide transporter [Aspergillus sclerotioniger CBS 115572]PWY90434.1 monosaccharide transporter [Aspergillus sclerotioniger CBS 115572]
MADGFVDASRVEAPVTIKTYLMCAFAAFGGIFFGYDSGYINGVMGMRYFIEEFEGLDYATTPADSFVIPSWRKSLITSILSAGTFFGALIAGDLADWFGRRTTIISGCVVFIVGVVLQTASTSLGLLVAGRLIAGFGVGFVSAIIILYMSEIAPRKVRGAIVSGYQFCITIGLMLASCVDYGTQNRTDSGSYRIPIALQIAWALILGTGLLFLPESPRFFVRKGELGKAAKVLGRVRGQPHDSEYIKDELAEIVANHQYEMQVIPEGGYFVSWMNCFRGSLFSPNSNLRRTVLGTSLQMMQQWTGVNFVFYFGTTFFQSLGTISDPFLISMITTIVNVCSTPVSFYTIEKFGRRSLLLWGALGMVICQFIVAIVGTVDGGNNRAVSAEISFICIYIFFFASTWGPGAWVVIGEIFPLPIRSRGVALSTASNWLWNCIIAVITPYMVDKDKGDLKARVFFIWGSLCACAFVYTYFLIPETKGLTLEQVDKMMEETTPRTSAKWVPHGTFAADMGLTTQEVTEKATAVHQEV